MSPQPRQHLILNELWRPPPHSNDALPHNRTPLLIQVVKKKYRMLPFEASTHRSVWVGAEDFRRNVARSAALGRHIAIHDAACETEVGELDVPVVVLGSQQEVFRLEVTVHDA